MYSELSKDKVWHEKYNNIIDIDNYIQDTIKEYKLNLENEDDNEKWSKELFFTYFDSDSLII